MAINIQAALKALKEAGIDIKSDFHAIPFGKRDIIAKLADDMKYRAPRFAKASPTRCFFEALQYKATPAAIREFEASATTAKAEAVAWADAHTQNVGLPTYSELMAALQEAVGLMPLGTKKRAEWVLSASKLVSGADRAV